MKKIIALLITAAILLTTVTATPDANTEREADIFDTLEILKHLADIHPNKAAELFGRDDFTIFDVLEILKGLIGLDEAVRVYAWLKPPVEVTSTAEGTAVVGTTATEVTTTATEVITITATGEITTMEETTNTSETTTVETTIGETTTTAQTTMTHEYDFCGRTVLVVLDKNLGAINKVHDPAFFGDFEIEEIEDSSMVFCRGLLLPSDYRPVPTGKNIAIEEYFVANRPECVAGTCGHGNTMWAINRGTWRQRLAITLSKDCKQNVLDFIAVLEKTDGIISAEPSYIGHLDWFKIR